MGKFLKLFCLINLGICGLKIILLLNVMLRAENPGDFLFRLWFNLAMAFALACVVFGKKAMVSFFKSGFAAMCFCGLYFACILLMNNYICAPLMGETVSGIVSMLLIMVPVLVLN